LGTPCKKEQGEIWADKPGDGRGEKGRGKRKTLTDTPVYEKKKGQLFALNKNTMREPKKVRAQTAAGQGNPAQKPGIEEK